MAEHPEKMAANWTSRIKMTDLAYKKLSSTDWTVIKDLKSFRLTFEGPVDHRCVDWKNAGRYMEGDDQVKQISEKVKDIVMGKD